MTDFLRNLPKPIRSFNRDKDGVTKSVVKREAVDKEKKVHRSCYEYLKRKHLKITDNEDFQGGGAYPEIHEYQYPNDMGRKKIKTKAVVKYIDDKGEVQYDNLINKEIQIYNNTIDKVETNERINKLRKKKILSSVNDIKEKYNEPLYKPDEEEENEIIENTRKNIESILNEKLNKKITNVKDEKFYRYIPKNKLNNKLEERIIKVVETSVDPLSVSKFRHKKLPNVKNSPEYPILRSPNRKLNEEEEQEWKVPPCVSNWKNNKGYNIPLDKRIQSDNRKLNTVAINENFAHLSEYLYVAEKKAREEIRMRNQVLKQKKLKEKEEKENALRKLALEARREKGAELEKESSIIKERKREIEREYKIEKSLKKMKNYETKVIDEQLALNKEIGKGVNIHDISLFNVAENQNVTQDDETYQVYDTALFENKANAHVYKFSSDRMKKTMQKLETKESNEPIKFVKEISDPFGLDSLLSEAKKKK